MRKPCYVLAYHRRRLVTRCIVVIMAQPLFVLGKQRSGTTWLANQLSQHSQIAAARDDHHGGILESAYFSHVYGRYGDLSHRTNFVEFAEVMAASDMMRILGVSKEFLYSLWPTTYEGVFQAVMDQQAQKKRARYWLDKTPEHTLMIAKLAGLYPTAKFVAIIRNPGDVMRSSMGRYSGSKRKRRYALIRGGLNLAHHNREVAHFAGRSDRLHVVKFEAMKQAPEATLSGICDFLGLAFEPALLAEHYAPNTTFYGNRKRDEALSKNDERLLHRTVSLGYYLPLSSFRAARYLKDNVPRKPLPKWFFSMYPPVFEEQSGKL